ncbi:MAG: hypothetical protein A2252_11955 [Elusimicrobia bacterium RIFOXYA2_FULL_39_19]|nr:MAG: hypothetical protein A2252_11955 [Elusimicrobia bacterium RIFOXYA2_FULL_39_19]
MNMMFLLDDKNYSKHIEEIISGLEDSQVKKFLKARDMLKDMVLSKPQLIFINSKNAATAEVRKIMADFSFVPFISYGDFGKNIKSNKANIRYLQNNGYSLCLPAADIVNKESAQAQIKNLLWQSLAKSELWEKQLDISKVERTGRFYRAVLTVVMTLAILSISGIATKDRFPLTRYVSPVIFTIPYLNISGISLSKNTLWTSDWQTQNIYKHKLNSELSIERVYSFPGIRISGLVVADGSLWTLDSWNKVIRKHNLDKRLSVSDQIVTPGSNPTGIAYNGKYIITIDNATDKLYIHKIDEKLTVLKEYKLPQSNPIGLHADEKYIWIADAGANKIFCCTIDDFDLKVKNVFIPPDYEGYKFSSISGDEDYLWLASEKESKIFKYPKEMLEPVE